MSVVERTTDALTEHLVLKAREGVTGPVFDCCSQARNIGMTWLHVTEKHKATKASITIEFWTADATEKRGYQAGDDDV